MPPDIHALIDGGCCSCDTEINGNPIFKSGLSQNRVWYDRSYLNAPVPRVSFRFVASALISGFQCLLLLSFVDGMCTRHVKKQMNMFENNNITT